MGSEELPTKHSFVFLVYSPRDYDSSMEESLKMVNNAQCYWMVKEYGKSGSHPHLNVVYLTSTRKDNFRRQLYRYYQLDPKTNKRVFKVKAVPDIIGLAGYLSKEERHELLYDVNGTFHEYLAKNDVDQRYFFKSLTTPYTLECVTEDALIAFGLEYFEGDDKVPTVSEFRRWQTLLVQKRYYCSRVKWSRVYNYICVFHGHVLEADEFPQLLEV